MRRTAFTLIELLIVVAIIAILAAIAVPNFLEAQVRSKVSRTKADMRSLATAIEAYAVDYNHYPSTRICRPPSPSAFSGQSVFYSTITTGAVSPRFIKLTTPVAFISSVFMDPFTQVSGGVSKVKNPSGVAEPGYDTYDYVSAYDFKPPDPRGGGITSGAMWRLCSAGPDGIIAFGGGAAPPNQPLVWAQLGVDYDPTNGTVSAGDLVRVGGGPANFGYLPSIDRIQNKYNF
ncbi:MAG: hypothetical protein Kow0059_07950 [Candidatus Sumerlaeia bacterium]